MRQIDRIVIHCAYTRPDMDIGAAEIRRWHTDEPPKGNGWRDIGYHWVIRRDGTIEAGRNEEIAGAHVAGHNATSIGVCLVGGMSDAAGSDCNFTRDQWRSLESLVGILVGRYPGAKVCGHRDLTTAKTCPTFDAAAWWAAQSLEAR